MTASMASTTLSEATLRYSSSFGVLTARKRSSGASASIKAAFGRPARNARSASAAEESGFDPDPPARKPDGLQMLDRRGHGARAIPGGDKLGRPERAQFPLGLFRADADIARPLDMPALVDEERRIAPDAYRGGMGEEEESVAAEQVADIVLRGDNECVDPGVIEDGVQLGGVEGDRGILPASRPSLLVGLSFMGRLLF